MLTFLYPRNRTAIVLDRHFNIHKIFQTSLPESQLDNMHDLHFVDNGKRVLHFYDETKNLSAAQSEGIGFSERNCTIRENSFHERDLTQDWDVVFSWQSSDHVEMAESTSLGESVEQRCTAQPKVSHMFQYNWSADVSSCRECLCSSPASDLYFY